MTQEIDYSIDDSHFEQTVSEGGLRLDSYMSEAFQITRSKASVYIDRKLVKVNGAFQKKSYVIQSGDVIVFDSPADEEYDVTAENIPLDIVYQDHDLIIVNKPQGMVVHPAPGNTNGTLVNALMYHIKDLSGINGILRPGIVHRIDKNTSGLLIVAKNDKSHVALAQQIKEHSFDRYYEAVLHGTPKDDNGTVNFSIGRSRTDRKKMAAFDENCSLPGVRTATTHYSVLASTGKYSHVRLKLETEELTR